MACREPPSYTFSGPAPDYRLAPEETETTLQHTPRWHGVDNTEPTCFHKTWPQGVKVTLHHYHKDQFSQFPTYAKNSHVSGEVEVDDRNTVMEVVACLHGKLDISVTNGSGCHIKLARERVVLWSAANSASCSASICPAILPLSLRFPSTYTYNGNTEERLPPSYDFVSYALVVLMASCSYNLTITITRSRKSKLIFWKPVVSYVLPLCYRPRTRPIRPLLQEPSPFSHLKVCPEEFLMIPMTILPKRQDESTHPPLHCQFLLPSVQTFCLTDSIPCHIQVQGPARGLSEFFSQTDVQDAAETGLPMLKGKSKRSRLALGSSKPIVRVFIARQIFVDISGRKSWRTLTIGECTHLVQDSPQYDEPLSNNETMTMDWSGMVECKKDVSTVGFISGPLTVKDYLVFSLTPAFSSTSKYPSLHHAHPIRLVTDPWQDDTLIHPSDFSTSSSR